MSERCGVIALIRPLPEHHEEVRESLLRVIPRVHGEPGCELYALHEAVDGTLIFVEMWTTRQHWQEHMDRDTVQEVMASTAGKLAADIEVHEAYGLPAGLSEKGVLPESS